MRWNIPARSPTQLDICPCANAPKNIKTVTTLAAHPDWPHGPPSETAWTGLHLTQEPQRWTWSKQNWNTHWLACFFSEAETTSKYPGVRATRTGQSGGVSLKIRLGRLTLPSASHKLRPWSRSYMDFMTSMYAQTLLLPVLLGGKQSYVKTVIDWPDESDGELEGWPQLLATVHPEPSISFQPSLHDLAIMTVPCWHLIQNNAICMVWVDWQAPQLAMHPITTTGCLFQWHNVHLHTTFTGQRAVRFDCHGFASLPVDWPCSLNQGWNHHATGVEPHSHKLVLALARTVPAMAWPKVHNGNCHFFWLAMVYMFLPPFLRLCSHRLAEGGPCDCPGLACTNQAHLQHGFSQAMHKFIVFVPGLLGHNLCRKQKSILYPDCPYKAVHCRCKQKLPAQGMLGSVTSHRSVLPKTSINSMIFNNGMQTILYILW